MEPVAAPHRYFEASSPNMKTSSAHCFANWKTAFAFLAAAALAQNTGLRAAESLAEATKRLDAEHPTLKIGSPLPDFALMGTDDKIHTPAEFADKKLLVVLFLTNHCPVSQLYEGRAKKLYDEFASKGVGFVAIQPDDVRGTL